MWILKWVQNDLVFGFMHNRKVTLRWDCENYICQEVTKMGSMIIGYRIDWTGPAKGSEWLVAHTQPKVSQVQLPRFPLQIDFKNFHYW